MFTIIPSLANSPTALSLPPSVLAVTATDTVSTRQTSVALTAPLSNQPTADNAQSNIVLVPATPAQENSAPAIANAGNASAPTTSNLNTTGPSSSFLAQLFSQGNEDSNSTAIATTYARFAPAPEYNTFVGYGFIKYKPSGAGLPPQRSPLPSPVTSYTQSEAPPVLPAAVSQNSQDTAVPEPASVTIPVDQNATAEAFSVPVPVVTSAPPQALSQNIPSQNIQPQIPVQNSAAPSPISVAIMAANDVQAYNQTASRNQSNLSSAQSQLSIDG